MTTRRNLLIAGGTLLTGLAAAGAYVGLAGTAEAGPIFHGETEGVAINGYDAVAYFTQNAPVAGSSDHVFDWRGARWHFASAENRAAFAADPERYAPRYGGFCAFAMAQGQKVKTDPAAFSIVDGKLYLNYDLPVRDRWDADRANFIAAADERWPKVSR